MVPAKAGRLMKRRVVHLLQKYLFNPPVKLLFTVGLFRSGYALLETIGRKSGKRRRTPVGDGRVGGQFWIVAEHGRKAGYVRNIEASPRVRLRLRDGFRSRWHTGTAHLLPDDDPRARQDWLARQVRGAGSNAAAVRFFGTELLTVRIDLDE
jgi:deazaflavin-dependent oxidoreductase (nitroreductase family)